MREIKFRAWDKKENKMFVFDIWTPIKELSLIEDNRREPFYHYQDWELMQYTGLKDKNGKEIYEGDIVRCWSGQQEDYLDFRELVGAVNYHQTHYRVNDNSLALDSAEWVEVIGNIYENPELLKV